MNNKKLVSVSIPCLNEEQNVVAMADAVAALFENELPQYDYVLQFIDNCSTDATRLLLRKICNENPHVCAIFNARNFGGISSYYGILQTTGDCTVVIPCDFQVPVELIPELLAKWEQGAQIVCAVKTESKESRAMWLVRSLYYKLTKFFSDTEVLEHFNGAGLYDKSFLDICRSIDDPIPSMGHLVTTLGHHVEKVEFMQPLRRAGKSKGTLWTLIDEGMDRFVHHSSIGPRIATLMGFAGACISLIVGIVFLVIKLINWYQYPAGIIPLILIVCFTAAVQLFFVGLIGEYVTTINTRLQRHPMVVEEKRIGVPFVEGMPTPEPAKSQ